MEWRTWGVDEYKVPNNAKLKALRDTLNEKIGVLIWIGVLCIRWKIKRLKKRKRRMSKTNKWSGVEAESWIMNHGCKIRRNHEFSRLKLGNHESRKIVKRIMNHEIIIPSIFSVFMWCHHFPKPKNINLCEVLVYLMYDPLKTWRFPTFEPDRVPHYVIEYPRQNEVYSRQNKQNDLVSGWSTVVICISNGMSCNSNTLIARKPPFLVQFFLYLELMMFCSACGSLVDQNANFCKVCGICGKGRFLNLTYSYL